LRRRGVGGAWNKPRPKNGLDLAAAPRARAAAGAVLVEEGKFAGAVLVEEGKFCVVARTLGAGWLLDQAATFTSFKKAGAPVVLGPPKHRGWARYANHRRAGVRFVVPRPAEEPKGTRQGAGAERQRRGRPARTHDASGPRQRRAPRPGPSVGGSG
jgi:hypothetical protein